MSNDTNTPDVGLEARALLVQQTVRVWNGRKLDSRVTREVAHSHEVAPHVGRYFKRLLPRKALHEVSSTGSRARTLHYQMTLPWEQRGARLLPAPLYLRYTTEHRELESDFALALDAFEAGYAQRIEEARKELNGMFDPDDYPDPWQIRTKFELSYAVYPVPDTDYRVALSAPELDRLKANTERQIKAALEGTTRDCWQRLYAVVQHLREHLAPERRVFESQVLAVRELCGLLRSLNMAGDPELESMRAEVEASLTQHSAMTLRASETARVKTASAADDILKRMAGYCGGAS